MDAPLRPAERLAGVSAIFDGARLTLARQLLGLKKVELARLIDMAPASVSAWESGTKSPNASAVARLSMALGVEPQFFASGSAIAPSPTPPHFRSLRSTTQTAQDQASAYGRLAGDIASLIEKSVELPARDLPSYPLSGTQPSSSGPKRPLVRPGKPSACR